MADMGERPLYLQKHITRHGRVCWYVRVKRGKLIRLRGEYGSEAFWDQYRAALAGAPLPNPKPNSASLQWLYDAYRQSLAWSGLKPATRRQRENILARVMKKAGHEPFKAIDAADITGGLDDRKATPAQARNYLDAMQGLFRWAKANNHVTVDPTAGVERPKRSHGGDGFPVWDEGDVASFRKKWPVGTRQRLWLELLLGTGLRRGDVVRAGWQHVRDGMLSIQTEKTGEWAHAVITPELQAILEKGPTADLAFVCGETRRPLTKESFGNMFAAACREAGIKKNAHGVRKLAATRDADAAWSDRALEAKYGWTGGFMASRYTRSANRKRIAREAAMLAPVRPLLAPENSACEPNGLDMPEIGLGAVKKSRIIT